MVRSDLADSALRIPYEDRFLVVQQYEKYQTILVKLIKPNVSIIRLKPYFVEKAGFLPQTLVGRKQAQTFILIL